MGSVPVKLKGIKTHLRSHMDYPATKKELIDACSGMMDIPRVDREWIERRLPVKMYGSASEVISALRI